MSCCWVCWSDAPTGRPCGLQGSTRRPVGTSYYGRKFDCRRTASGERYDRHGFAAAHRSLEFGTRVEVSNLKNGKIVQVRINDHGPHKRRRIIDLSYAVAQQIGMMQEGVVKVTVVQVR